MRIITSTVPGSARLKRVAELSRMAKQRLKWMDYYQAHGENAALTCRYHSISRQTFYRWKRRYNARHMPSLEERPHQALVPDTGSGVPRREPRGVFTGTRRSIIIRGRDTGHSRG